MHCTVLNDIRKQPDGIVLYNPDGPVCIDNELGSPTFGEVVDCGECTSCADIPVITTEIEYVCNEDTNVYDLHAITITDGVAADPVITPTEISCDIDIELSTVKECRDGIVTIVHYVLIEEEGTPEEILAIPTAESCVDTTPFLIRECREGFINIVTYLIDNEGVKVEIGATPTEEVCNDICIPSEPQGLKSVWGAAK